jgi:hypothetical protein
MANPFMRKQGRNHFIPLIHGPSKGNLVSSSLSLSLSLSLSPSSLFLFHLSIYKAPHNLLHLTILHSYSLLPDLSRAIELLESRKCNVDGHFLLPSEECDGGAAGNFLRQAASVRETSSGGFPFFPVEIPAPFYVSCIQRKRRAQPKDGFASV